MLIITFDNNTKFDEMLESHGAYVYHLSSWEMDLHPGN